MNYHINRTDDWLIIWNGPHKLKQIMYWSRMERFLSNRIDTCTRTRNKAELIGLILSSFRGRCVFGLWRGKFVVRITIAHIGLLIYYWKWLMVHYSINYKFNFTKFNQDNYEMVPIIAQYAPTYRHWNRWRNQTL